MLSEWRMGPRQRILLETNPIYRVVSRRLWNGWTGLIVLKGATHRKALVFSLVLFVHVLCDDSQILCCFCAVIAAVHSQFLNRIVSTHVVLISLQLSRSKRTNWAFERSWNNQCFVVDVFVQVYSFHMINMMTNTNMTPMTPAATERAMVELWKDSRNYPVWYQYQNLSFYPTMGHRKTNWRVQDFGFHRMSYINIHS